MNIKVKKLYKDVVLPEYKTSGAAAFDFESMIDIIINPNETKIIPTGLAFEIPDGYELQVRPRSGLALKKGITVLNTPGTVDADYREEIHVILINQGHEAVYIEDGERIAQLVFGWACVAEWEEVARLNETDRKGGFGHTGEK